MKPPRLGCLLLTIPAVALIAACGTTVPLGDQKGMLSAGSIPTATLPAGEPSSHAQAAASGTIPKSDASAGPSYAAASSVPAWSDGQALSGGHPSQTATETGGHSGAGPSGSIKIGTDYTQGANQAFSSLGFSQLQLPDTKAIFDRMVSWVNAHGGLAGKKIQPVYYQYSATGDPQTQDQAACAQFTQDDPVHLVIGGVTAGAGQLLPCLAQHGVPEIGFEDGDASYWDQYHTYLYSTDAVNYTRALASLVQGLQAQGFFSGSVKLGLVQIEGPIYDRAIDGGLLPALAHIGVPLDQRAKVANDDSIASATANAELKFASLGINHVIFMAPGGGVATYFMEAANTQHYKPSYGLWSADSPYVLQQIAPQSQLMGSVGIGYRPELDVASTSDPTATTSRAKACLAIFAAAGMSTGGSSGSFERETCDEFFVLRDVASANPDALTSPPALEAGFDALGSGYSPAIAFQTRFVPGHHDGGFGYRRLDYVTSCSCFSYEGPTVDLTE